MIQISKRYSFSASHVLEGLEEGHPCSRLHGHNYEVEFILEGEEIGATGMLVDYRELDRRIKPMIDGSLDHRHLNDVVTPSTAECLAAMLFGAFEEQFPQLVAVRVSETPKTWAEFRR